MRNNVDNPRDLGLIHGVAGFIHQPRPRRPGPNLTRFTDPVEPPEPSGLLPTPSSTPEPRVPATRLTVASISECEAKFSNSDVLGRALDALPGPTGPDDDYRLVTLDRDTEDEYIVSARRFGRGEISDAYEQAWSRLDGDHNRSTAVASPIRTVDVPTSSAQLYMTPPSSPEPARIRRLAPAANIDSLSLDAETTPTDDPPSYARWGGPVNNDREERIEDGLSNEKEGLGFDYTDDYEDYYDYDDDDDCEEEEFDDDVEMTLSPPAEPCSPISSIPPYNSPLFSGPPSPSEPSAPAYIADLRRFTASPVNFPDLTSALDPSSFDEWPVARGGFGDVWKGALVDNPSMLCSRDVSGSRELAALDRCKDGLSVMVTSKRRAVAVKRLTMYTEMGEEAVRKTMKRTAREVYIWSHLKHRNVLPLLGTCSFRGGVGIVSPWQEAGNATAWVCNNPSTDRLKLSEGICAGLTYLHRNGVIHGDLRGANVLISARGTPRLIDFGLASVVGGIPAFSASTTMAGTVRWMAPELQVVEGHSTTAASDVFALGMTILELHTGAPPFAGIKNDIAVLLKYQRGERPPRPTNNRLKPRNPADVCVEMDDATWTLVQECWQQDDERRPSAKEALRRLKRRRGQSGIK
ncbi:kinase-like protein [Ceratobasidium sp. AG-I]|nr:kinase-like protein [Ceratobasidium sp. AG-I]